MKIRTYTGKTERERGKDIPVTHLDTGCSIGGNGVGAVSIAFREANPPDGTSWTNQRVYIELTELEAHAMVTALAERLSHLASHRATGDWPAFRPATKKG